MNTRRFSGEYADNGKETRRRVREEAGNRCIRCMHPFETGKHGKGEWSPCDERCTHQGPLQSLVPTLGWLDVTRMLSGITAGQMVARGQEIRAQWRILTVHHLDGQKDNDHWANTLSLCQRCHLQIQGKVDPRIPYFLEHSDWFKPYAAAYYAKKYEGREITSEEAVARMDELLAYELRA